MGWTPRPRWERARKRWYFSAGGKRYTSVSVAGIAAKYAAVVGTEPPTDDAKVPQFVSDAIRAWLVGRDTEFHRYCLQHFNSFAGGNVLADLESRLMERFAAHLVSTGYAPKTVHHLHSHAWRVLAWCHTHGWVARMPARPKLPAWHWAPKALTTDELADLLANLEAPRRNRLRRIASFLLATGARPTEARTLRWSDVDPPNRTCRLRRSKTGKPRVLYLTDDALAVLAETPRISEFVFLARGGKPYTRDGLAASMRRVGCGPYRLRHTFAQFVRRQGADIALISKMLGHSGISVTQAYVRVEDQELRRAACTLTSPLSAGDGGYPPASAAPPAQASAPSSRSSRRPSPRKRPKARRRRTA